MHILAKCLIQNNGKMNSYSEKREKVCVWVGGGGAAKGQFRFVFKIQFILLYSIHREIINFVANYTLYHSKHDI